MTQLLAELPPVEETLPSGPPVLKPDLDAGHFDIEQVEDGWRVHGERVERRAFMTRWELFEAVNSFQKMLERTGITEALEKAGVQDGDTVYIADAELIWGDV
ncbi:MAG: Obg family GTPase CgtA [Delftia sp.]|nr:Obg family GTPase CgtA [Delftia sp.]